jgi:hypothetical protein
MTGSQVDDASRIAGIFWGRPLGANVTAIMATLPTRQRDIGLGAGELQ